jgi:CheY-like chemotaxis protein
MDEGGQGMSQFRELVIIIADDDDGHAELIREGLQNSGLANTIIRFSNGEEVWNFLNGKTVLGHTRVAEKSYLLLLDINMPRMDGIEVLERMKSDPEIRDVPVIMLTTTDDPREVERCYRLGCNVYITKPVEFANFTKPCAGWDSFCRL